MYDESEVARRWFQTRKVYERAVLPIDKGGMALRNVRPVFFGYFACSLAASLKDLVKVFPDNFCMSSLADLHARVMKSSALRSIVKLFLKERLGIIITSLLY